MSCSVSATRAFAVPGLLLLLVLTTVLSLVIGAKSLPASVVLDALTGSCQSADCTIVLDARLPRTLAGLLAGGALGLAGALMQTLTRNPLADPEAPYVATDGNHAAGELMARDVRQRDVRIVSHPAMPVGATDARCLHLENQAMRLRRRVGQGADLRPLAEQLVEYGAQSDSPGGHWPTIPAIARTM